MSIYTKTGDSGTTGLLGGARVRKDDARIEACGAVDEVNAVIGLARAADPPTEVARILETVQRDLLALGAELATPPEQVESLGSTPIRAADVNRLEQAMDALERELPQPTGFVLPAGCRAAATLHQARTVCRRAERRVVGASQHHAIRADVLVYLNRLSDLLYLLARRSNLAAGTPEEGWSRQS